MAYRINNKTEIVFAHEGENNAREIRFDVSGYPDGIIYLELLRYGDSYAYPITLERDGNEAVWLPDSTATAKRGTGRGQLVVMADDEVIYKSDVFKAINRYSLSTTEEVPDGYDSWIQRLENLGADIEGKTTDGLNAINEAKDSALDRISTVSADGIEAINTAKRQGVNAVNSAKTDSLDAIERKKEAVHTELDGYVAEHHDELKGEKGDKGDDYIVTDEDLKAIGDRVEAEYEPNLNALKEEVSHKAEATDLATANRKIKALTDVLNGKELAFEQNDYEGNVEVPSGAVADSILKIGGKSRKSYNEIRNGDIVWFGNSGGRIEETGSYSLKLFCTGQSVYSGVYTTNLVKFKPNTVYTISFDCSVSDGDKIRVEVGGTSFESAVPTNGRCVWTVTTPPAPSTNVAIYGGSELFEKTITISNLMIEEGSTAHDFEPYFEGIISSQTDAVGVYKADKTLDKQIPTNLPVLRSAVGVYDFVEAGKHHTFVGVITMRELVERGDGFGYAEDYSYVLISDRALTKNVMVFGYSSKINTVMINTGNTGIPLKYPSGTYANWMEFYEDNKNTVFYYELAEPIIEEIDPLPQLEAINVEAGGQISFIDHSDMSFAIPSTHEFIVRNAEV